MIVRLLAAPKSEALALLHRALASIRFAVTYFRIPMLLDPMSAAAADDG